MYNKNALNPRVRLWCAVGAAVAALALPAWGTPQVMGTLTTAGIVGDANKDGIADALDLAIVNAHLNQAGGLAQGDFDANGLVNDTDLTLLNNHFKRARPSVYFGKVAAAGTAVPSAAVTFGSFNTPMMDSTGTIAFVGSGGSVSGMYKYQSGALTRVADNTLQIPGATAGILFANFGSPSLNKGKLAFVGYDPTAIDGIYSDRTGALTKLVNRSTPRNGSTGSGFSGFGDPDLTDTGVSFIGNVGLQSGVFNYTFANSLSANLTMTTSAVPSGTGNFTGFGSVSTDGTTIQFTGTGYNQAGVYRTVAGTTTAFMDLNSTITGTNAKFTSSISEASRSVNNFSYNSTLGGRSGIFASIDGAISTVATTDTLVPEGNGRFSKFFFSAMGGNGVAFVGYDATNQPGIYGWSNGELTRIIDSSITLGGKLIKDLQLSTQAVVANKVVFKALFADNTSGVFVASLVPAPAPGDVNGDGVTNSADLRILKAHYGQSGGYAQGDLNGDGTVDFADYQIIERNFGRIGLTPLRGDADGDGKIDSADFKILYANYGKHGTVAQGDFDEDGLVTFNDFQILEAQFAKTTSAQYLPFGATVAADLALGDISAVPEPGTIGLVAVAMGLLGGRRRR